MTAFNPLDPLQDVIINLTENQVTEISEWFEATAKPRLTVNEENTINAVTVEEFKQFLALKKFHRRSFHYPSYAEIMDEAEFLKAGITKMFIKEQLIYMLNKWIIQPDLKHEIKLAFKIFDTENRDFLDIEELKMIVTGYGDVFNESETIEMLRDANVTGNGNVFYNDFVESIFKLAPELEEIKPEYLYEDPDEDPSVPPEPVEEVVEPPPPPPPPQPVPQPTTTPPAKKKK